MIDRSADVRGALRRRQRGFIINPFRFGAGGVPGAGAALPIMSGLLLHLDASAAGSGVIGRGAQALLSASAGAAATLGRLRSLAATLAAPSISQCPDRRTT